MSADPRNNRRLARALARESLRPSRAARAVPDAVQRAFMLPPVSTKSRFMGQAGRTSVQFNINAEQIRRVGIPLPPVRLQEHYVKLATRARATGKHGRAAVRDQQMLVSSLTQRAFSGKL